MWDSWHPFVSIPPSNFIFRGEPASYLRSVFFLCWFTLGTGHNNSWGDTSKQIHAASLGFLTPDPNLYMSTWRKHRHWSCRYFFHKRNCRARERNRTLFNLMSHSRVWLIFPEFCPTTDKKYFTGPRDGDAGVGSQKCIRLRQRARGS